MAGPFEILQPHDLSMLNSRSSLLRLGADRGASIGQETFVDIQHDLVGAIAYTMDILN